MDERLEIIQAKRLINCLKSLNISDKLMKELGPDNAILIIGLLAIVKDEAEEINERKLI